MPDRTGVVCAGAIVVATAAAPAAHAADISGLDSRAMLLIADLAGALAFAIVMAALFLRERRRRARERREAELRLTRLRAQLAETEALVDRDDEIVVVWNGGAAAVKGDAALAERLTRGQGAVPAFGRWLEPASAMALDRAVDRLREQGEPFELTLRTLGEARVGARGRVAAGRAVLRLRTLEGERLAQARLGEKLLGAERDLACHAAFLAAIPLPLWRRGPDGRLSWVNPAYAQAVEAASPEQAVTERTELLDKAERLRLVEAAAQGRDFRARLPAVVAGRRRVLDVLEIARPPERFGLAVDATEAEEAKAELSRHIAAHARTLDQLATAVAVFGPDRRLRFHNAAYRSLFGLDSAWLATSPEDGAILDRLRAARKLPEQADYRTWRRTLLEAYRSLDPFEQWWHLPDGRTLRLVVAPEPQGGVVCFYEDHTERLALESRFNVLSRIQGETLDALREGVAVFGSDGRLKLSNPAFAALWQIPAGMLAEGPHVDAVAAAAQNPAPPGAWLPIKRAVTSLPETRPPAQGRIERSDGSVLDFAAEPLPDGGTLVTFADATANVAMQRALEERNEALEAADRLKNAFVQHVSYELRSPLTNIIGFAQLLADERMGRLDARQRDYADHILASSAALLAIINDILDLATIDAGAMELDLAQVDIRACVEAAAEGIRDRVAEAKIRLDIVAPPDIGGFVADEKRVRQVLFNLLSNAVGFSEPGGTVRLVCTRDAQAVTFTVKDEGRGIPPDEMAAVFDRFVSRPRGSRHRGAGLGLTIVKSFVELHGGTVSIDSAPGRGTTVSCRFPLRRTGAETEARRAAAG
jgi:signal transduction histidine kinase